MYKCTSVWSTKMKAGKTAAPLSWQVTDNSKSFIWKILQVICLIVLNINRRNSLL